MPPPKVQLKKPKPGDAARLPSKASKNLPSCSQAAWNLLFELSPVELIEVVAQSLQETVSANKDILHGEKQPRLGVTRFHTRDPPAISVLSYLKRLLQLAPFPLDALLLAVVYTNRITYLECKRSPSSIRFQPLFTQYRPPDPGNTGQTSLQNGNSGSSPPTPPPLTPWTVHRLVLATLAIASKFSSDAYIGQKRLAKVGGVSVKELFELEVEIFDQLSWSCYVSQEELDSVCGQLWRKTAKASTLEIPVDTAAQQILNHPGSLSPNLAASPDSLRLGSLSLSPIVSCQNGTMWRTTPSEEELQASRLQLDTTRAPSPLPLVGHIARLAASVCNPPPLVPIPLQ